LRALARSARNRIVVDPIIQPVRAGPLNGDRRFHLSARRVGGLRERAALARLDPIFDLGCTPRNTAWAELQTLRELPGLL
jgi:hypothetical protein